MYRKFVRPSMIGVVLAAVLLVLTTGSGVNAHLDSSGIREDGAHPSEELQLQPLPPVEGGPGYFTISPWDFTPEVWSQGRSYWPGMLINSHFDLAYFIAPAHLPHGVTVSKMVAYYYDNAGPDLDITFSFLECTLSMGVCKELIHSQTAHGYDEPRIGEYLPAENVVIDLQSKYYLVKVGIAPAAGLGVTGIRIDYGYPVSLPVIMR